ncbi:uncharacterized protein LOC111945012, partial [Cyanistes caeruleus]|uniref:uncharacterized protein LOC111945012 n=1 Tax=Cyanistes caeruleus TaxID=156563 RepID=UPI000CDABFF1
MPAKLRYWSSDTRSSKPDRLAFGPSSVITFSILSVLEVKPESSREGEAGGRRTLRRRGLPRSMAEAWCPRTRAFLRESADTCLRQQPGERRTSQTVSFSAVSTAICSSVSLQWIRTCANSKAGRGFQPQDSQASVSAVLGKSCSFSIFFLQGHPSPTGSPGVPPRSSRSAFSRSSLRTFLSQCGGIDLLAVRRIPDDGVPLRRKYSRIAAGKAKQVEGDLLARYPSQGYWRTGFGVAPSTARSRDEQPLDVVVDFFVRGTGLRIRSYRHVHPADIACDCLVSDACFLRIYRLMLRSSSEKISQGILFSRVFQIR